MISNRFFIEGSCAEKREYELTATLPLPLVDRNRLIGLLRLPLPLLYCHRFRIHRSRLLQS